MKPHLSTKNNNETKGIQCIQMTGISSNHITQFRGFANDGVSKLIAKIARNIKYNVSVHQICNYLKYVFFAVVNQFYEIKNCMKT